MDTAEEVLSKAADLIESTGWTRRALARNALGYAIGALSREATCYCSIGAIKTLRTVFPGMGLKEAKDLVDQSGIIAHRASAAEAAQLNLQLTEQGHGVKVTSV